MVPFEVVLGDFDGDGVPDIAVIDAAVPAIGYARGDGAGGFGQWWTRPLDAIAVRLHARDLNRDGRDDLIAATFVEGSLSILLGE